MQHRSAPDHRCVIGHEEPHRQATDSVRRGRHDEVADDERIGAHPQHLRHREPVDVRVEDANVVARLGQGDRQVDRDRRLAHSPLARGDPEDPGLRAGLHELVGPSLLVSERPTTAVIMAMAVVGRVHHPAVDSITSQEHA